MNMNSRKAAVAAYKKRIAVAGIYAVRCQPTGQVWVGRTLDIEKIETRLWFALRTGANQHRTMQKAWNEHGADNFTFEEIELLDDEEIASIRESRIKARLLHWRAELQAETV